MSSETAEMTDKQSTSSGAAAGEPPFTPVGNEEIVNQSVQGRG